MEAIYRVDGQHADTRKHAGGPWDHGMQHGAAPSALMLWAAENLDTRAPMRIARVSVDLLRPVPVTPLRYEAAVIREGRKIQLCGVRLLAKDTEVARATVLKLRVAPQDLPMDTAEPAMTLPLPEECPALEDTRASSTPFITGMSIRNARGSFLQPGPGAVWFRADRPVVEGAPITPAMRAMIASDFCNAVSVPLSFSEWTFINADLTMHLVRYPEGEWVILDGTTWMGPDGIAIAFARLGDAHGYFGRAIQSVLIERR